MIDELRKLPNTDVVVSRLLVGDYLIDGRVQLIFNTPRGKGARTDEGRIRAASVLYGVPCITTLPAAEACVRAMEGLRSEPLSVQPIQDRFPETAATR